MARALIVVDVQNDFCEGGALAVTGGKKVASDVTDFIEVWNSFYDLIIATRDGHAEPPSDNCGHFALNTEPDYVKSWPVHCVKDTHGFRYPPEFDISVGNIIHTQKGYDAQSYSGFESVDSNGTSILTWLRTYEINTIDVVGLAFDYCVKATALDSAHLGFNTTVLKSYTAGVSEANTEAVIKELTEAGVKIIG